MATQLEGLPGSFASNEAPLSFCSATSLSQLDPNVPPCMKTCLSSLLDGPLPLRQVSSTFGAQADTMRMLPSGLLTSVMEVPSVNSTVEVGEQRHSRSSSDGSPALSSASRSFDDAHSSDSMHR